MPKLIPKADPIVGQIHNMQNHKKSSKKLKKHRTVDEQLDLLIRLGKDSKRQKWQRVAKTLNGISHNDRFQRERIVTVLEMLEGQP